MPGSKRAVRAALRDILEKQIEADDPPEVKATFNRLRRDGESTETTWRLLSAVLMLELWEILRTEREFDRARYVAHLHALPTLPRELGDDASGASEAGA